MAGRRAGEGGVFLLVPKRTPSNLKSQKNPIRYSSHPFPSRNYPKPARSNHFPFFCRGRGVGYPYPAIIWPLVMEEGSFHRDTDNHTSNEASQFRTSSVSPPNYLKERERKKPNRHYLLPDGLPCAVLDKWGHRPRGPRAMNTRGGKKKAFFSYVKLTARVLGARRTKCC